MKSTECWDLVAEREKVTFPWENETMQEDAVVHLYSVMHHLSWEMEITLDQDISLMHSFLLESGISLP